MERLRISDDGAQVVGNLLLDASTATSGNILKEGHRFLHTSGSNSTFIGSRAGTLDGASDSTAVGAFALNANGGGIANTALRARALQNLADGSNNVAIGASAGTQLFSGANNLCISHPGGASLENHTIRARLERIEALLGRQP